MKTARLLSSLLLIAGCAANPQGPDVVGAGSQLEIRQMQTREYDTLDKRMTLRAVVSTLQDLGFTIDRADLQIGSVTGTKLDEYTMRITVTVREKGEQKIAVRANARIDEQTVDDPKTYQDFFVALDKAMFLVLQKVD
jgi:hypothetical protein